MPRIRLLLLLGLLFALGCGGGGESKPNGEGDDVVQRDAGKGATDPAESNPKVDPEQAVPEDGPEKSTNDSPKPAVEPEPATAWGEPVEHAGVVFEPIHRLVVGVKYDGEVHQREAWPHELRWDGPDAEYHLPYRYVEERMPAKVTLGDDEVDGEQVTWTPVRDMYPKSSRNHDFAEARFLRTDGFDVPRYLFSMTNGSPIPVPPGTVEFRCTKETAETYDGFSTYSVEYEDAGPVEHTLGRSSIPARAFEWEVVYFDTKSGKENGRVKGRTVVSPAIPGGVCEHEAKGRTQFDEVDIVRKVLTVRHPPVSPSIRVFEEYGFGLAPPEGFGFGDPEEGEFARLVGSGGRRIGLRAEPLAGRTFAKWWEDHDAAAVKAAGGDSELADTFDNQPWALHGRDGMQYGFTEWWYCIPVRDHVVVIHIPFEDTRGIDLPGGWRWIANSSDG